MHDIEARQVILSLFSLYVHFPVLCAENVVTKKIKDNTEYLVERFVQICWYGFLAKTDYVIIGLAALPSTTELLLHFLHFQPLRPKQHRPSHETVSFRIWKSIYYLLSLLNSHTMFKFISRTLLPQKIFQSSPSSIHTSTCQKSQKKMVRGSAIETFFFEELSCKKSSIKPSLYCTDAIDYAPVLGLQSLLLQAACQTSGYEKGELEVKA